jgi:uncharacterized protein (DUF305 family)
MKKAFIAALFLLLALTCTRRPVQKDIPIEHNSIEHTGIDHSKMESSPGAAKAPFELQFIDTMIAHHEGAIDAAQLVATRAAHPELKDLARSIIAQQQHEIAQMRAWRVAWFSEAAPAINIDLPGMREGMQSMDLDKLDRLKENEFDLEFIRQMIAHHEGAVTMAKQLLSGDVHAELRKLCEEVISSQTAEIEEMRNWEKLWGKKAP